MMNFIKRCFSCLPKGPDRILATNNISSTRPECPVRIYREKNDAEPISLYTCFKNRVELSPNYPFFVLDREGITKTWTYSESFREVEISAKALINLGLERFHGVCMVGFNAPQWYFSMLGSQISGGLSVGIYSTSKADACRYQAEQTKANIFIVENDEQLQKVLQIKHKLPHLKAIVQYTGIRSQPGVLSWQEFLEVGRNASDGILKERLEDLAVNQACSVLYTSGTTGHPKGVLLTPDSLLTTGAYFKKYNELEDGQRMISYMPSNHLLGMLLDVLLPLHCKSTVHFAKPDAFRGSLFETIKKVRPTYFFGVPRVIEKIYNQLKSVDKDAKESFESVGLDECELLQVGAAPCSENILRYFQQMGKPACELYGLTEGGVLSWMNNKTVRVTSMGQVHMHYKIDATEQDEGGELLVRGRTLMMGYLHNEEKTAEIFDEDGFIKTGDLVKMDEDRYIYMTGRSKELIITSGGLNIAPVEIENNVKEQLPILSNCMVVGDEKKYVSALLTLKTKEDPVTGEMTDQLQPEVVEWCKSLGHNFTTLEEVITEMKPEIIQAIEDGIKRANKKVFNRVHEVKTWWILPKDFTRAGDELGPTLKLVRPVVLKKYADIIERL